MKKANDEQRIKAPDETKNSQKVRDILSDQKGLQKKSMEEVHEQSRKTDGKTMEGEGGFYPRSI